MTATAPARERFWFVPHAMIVLAIVCVAGPIVFIGWAVASTSVGPISVADGGLVFWRDYPGSAEFAPEEVLDADRAEAVDADFGQITAEIDAALVAETGGQWNAADQQRTWSGESNGYSGSSMLSTVTATSYALGTQAADPAEQDRAIEIIRRVAGDHGFTGWKVDDASRDWEKTSFQGDDGVFVDAEYRWTQGSMSSSDGRTLFVTFDDWRTTEVIPVAAASPDPGSGVPGSVEETYAAGGLPPSSLSMTLSAAHLLPQGAETEFDRRLTPFDGLDRPRGSTDD